MSDYDIPGLSVTVKWNDAGGFQIAGYHLGAGAWVNRSDYEYYITIAEADLGSFAAALGSGTSRDEIVAGWNEQRGEIVTRGERTWLKEHNVPNSLWVV